MDKVGCEMICKSHSARSERDHYRICPTKLSKNELEDLYFALLENNMQLKKTVNVQQERIKVLSTKVQRMTSAQNGLRAEENNNCCVATKAVVRQQKETIAELTRANEHLADRVRKLNMRLCSAKQFCKSATPRGLRCSTATSPYLIKHSPCSYKQQSHSTLKLAVSCQNLSRESFVTKCVQTEPFDLTKLEEENKPCEDNKCRTLIDEYKEKIISLQEKLSATQQEYESELQRSRGEQVAREHELQCAVNKNALLTSNLRSAEGLNCELNMQLSIEKRRVVELETRLRTATMSNKVTKNIEDTLNSIQESNRTAVSEMNFICSCCSPRSKVESSSQQTYLSLSAKDGNNTETKLSKSTADSGYIDTSKSQVFLDDQSLNKIIDELTQRIMVLQYQVDALTISPPETKEDSPLVEERNTNRVTVVEHPKENLVRQTTFSQNPEDDIQLTGPESDEETSIIPGKEESSDVASPISNTEAGKNDLWEKSKSKLHRITNKTKDNATTVKEDTETIKNKEDKKNNRSREIIIESNEEIKETVHSSPVKNKEKKLKEQSSSTEDKTYNISNKVSPEIEKHKIKNKIVIKRQTSVHNNKISGLKEKVADNADSPRRSNKNKDDNETKKRKCTTKILINTNKEPRVEKLTIDRAVCEDVSTCDEATYTVESGDRPTSPDNTDCEISSMSDLTEDREPKIPTKCSLSPGERKSRTTHSDSCPSPSTHYSLSEGEIQVTTVRRRSFDDKTRYTSQAMATAPKMDETLQAITEEMARCKRLLFSQRSQDNVTSALT
ncbi:unnamed protein product [Arctia plantaginis]|uniref:Uncharacterized protein n=1 Tax=Arctia plantaginis TaxID=874455 RepID=A0A8S1A4V7_ARCPL|nr:unnamed protein product [Arctia plantaginis]